MKKHKIIVISLSVICIILLIAVSFLLGKNSNTKVKEIKVENTNKDSLFNDVPDSLRMRAKADSDAVDMGADDKDVMRKADSLTKVYMDKLKKENK